MALKNLITKFKQQTKERALTIEEKKIAKLHHKIDELAKVFPEQKPSMTGNYKMYYDDYQAQIEKHEAVIANIKKGS